MNKQVLLEMAIANIQKLPATKVKEVNDFAEFLLNRIDDQMINQGIQELASYSKSLEFLNNEPDLYSVSDLKIKYK